MQNFSIAVQIKKELNEFYSTKIKLASMEKEETVRYLKNAPTGYFFNQADAISLIDLYYNSKFEGSTRDSNGQRKIFLNVGKFRTDVSAKQIDLDVKDFKFIPDDFADPFTAIFMQKDFKEWAKDTDLSDLINETVDAFPKYGTVVLKKVGNDVKFVPIQNLRNEQTAESLETASFVIEEHPDMYAWEIKEMKAWDTKDLDLKYDRCYNVYERYGYVPLSFLKKNNGQTVAAEDYDTYVDAMCIVTFDIRDKNAKTAEHIFYAQPISGRPYREKHWTKQHGRWLGIGVMEDLVENQQAKNIIINLIRRSLQWSAKRVLQSSNTDLSAKNLVKDVKDGEILDVGANGAVTEISLSAKTNADFTEFLNEWEKNADQKAFTYEAATGESMPSGTPFRLGVILSQAVNSFFDKKREKLGIFWKGVIIDFKVPQFIKDMSNEERIVQMFGDEPGFEVLKDATIRYVRSEASRVSLLSGKAVDADTLTAAVQPIQNIGKLIYKLSKTQYKDAKVKFDLDVTGESVDIASKVETLKTLYQILVQQGDPRAEAVLDRITALTGESMAAFGPKPVPKPLPAPQIASQPQPNAQPQPIPAQA